MAARRKGFGVYPFGFRGLTKLKSANDAYRLYLAEALLDDGLPPREMLVELGLDGTLRQLDKYDPNQPRVPAGSGRESGQWTKDGGSASTSVDDDPVESTSDDEDPKVQLAGDVVHVGFLTSFFVIRGPDGIPRTFCHYTSAVGDFETSFLGIGECKSIEPVP
jgi:hypothetical protein